VAQYKKNSHHSKARSRAEKELGSPSFIQIAILKRRLREFSLSKEDLEELGLLFRIQKYADTVEKILKNQKRHAWLAQALVLKLGYPRSYLSRLSAILFFLSYGLTQTVVSRWIINPALDQGTRRMDFGQVVPLFLLALPLLAVLEILSGKFIRITANNID